MDDLHRYTEELARAHVAWAKAVPNGSDDEIRKDSEEVATVRRDLAQKMMRLDHLLGHPWRVGMPGNCDCNKQDEPNHVIVDGGFCFVVSSPGGCQNSGGP